MALAGSRTRQTQRIPWKSDRISGTKCRSLAQYITHKAHSPRNLRRLLLGTRTGYHSGDGRHWVRPHWLAASGQLGRSRLMTSRDRVLATTLVYTFNNSKDPCITAYDIKNSLMRMCNNNFLRCICQFVTKVTTNHSRDIELCFCINYNAVYVMILLWIRCRIDPSKHCDMKLPPVQ